MADSDTSPKIPNPDNFTGSISIFQPILNEFKLSFKPSLTDAISTSEQSLGNNAITLAAFIHPYREYMVLYNVYALALTTSRTK
jgi:hypothetical protein